jgi:hypothetical protein
MKTPISYYGGKQRMASKIVPLIPENSTLTIIEQGKAIKGKKGLRRYWKCQCVCGNIAEYREDSLKSGSTRICRPCSRKSQAEKITKHGHARKSGHSMAYRSWDAMVQRCTNNKHKHFVNYGERGIDIDDSWFSFESFLKDMGDPPLGLTLDRIDNNKGYSKENCRWASRKFQQNNRRNNRRFILDGIEKTAQEWSEHFGIHWNAVRGRLNRGWEPFVAFSTPINQNIWANRVPVREEIQKLYDAGKFDCFAS